MENYRIEFQQPYVDVKEAKASKRNGYIKGIVKNNTSNVIENKYMKVSLLSKNGVCLGEKYIKIEKLAIGQIIDLFMLSAVNELNTALASLR